MILKKPYAFFIKNFKLFHLILFILSSLLLYRTSLIYNFFREFVKKTPDVIGKDLSSPLFTSYAYILVVILIIVNIVIITVMIKKTKPYMYYILNIILYILILIIYFISHGIVNNLEVMLVSAKTTMAIRDILNISRMIQTISVIFYLIRATGFDIKKFDFVKDLHGLNISEEDSEEYEIAVDFEPNLIIRKIKRTLRNINYYYKENKFIINIILALLFSSVMFLIYASINKYDKKYNENDFFQASNVNFGIKESYIITNDYSGEKIFENDKVLVVLKISTSSKIEQELINNKLVLNVGENRYYSVQNYDKKLIDIGEVYRNQKITNKFKDYILVYEIPKSEKTKEMIFEYIDKITYEKGTTKTNSMKINIKPQKIDEVKNITHKYNITETIDTSSSKYSDYKITINSYEISDSFTGYYESCVNSKCEQFKEIMFKEPAASTPKTILKISGNIEYTNKINNIVNLFDYIKYFGRIEYKYNDKIYQEKLDFTNKKFKRIKDENYYIDVDKNIMEASEIKLIFKIRNNEYEYILRGEQND